MTLQSPALNERLRTLDVHRPVPFAKQVGVAQSAAVPALRSDPPPVREAGGGVLARLRSAIGRPWVAAVLGLATAACGTTVTGANGETATLSSTSCFEEGGNTVVEGTMTGEGGILSMQVDRTAGETAWADADGEGKVRVQFEGPPPETVRVWSIVAGQYSKEVSGGIPCSGAATVAQADAAGPAQGGGPSAAPPGSSAAGFSCAVRGKVTSVWNDPRPNGRRHKGRDFDLVMDQPVYSMSNGVVETTGYQERGAGKFVVVATTTADTGRKVFIEYFHLNSIAVSTGDQVNHSTVLGGGGNTGFYMTGGGDGTHLHIGIVLDDYGARNRDDPAKYMPDCSR